MPYDASWPEQFDRLRRLLTAALGPRALEVHHVGSTSVPGLAAKPIIDVDVVVEDSTRRSRPLTVAQGRAGMAAENSHGWKKPDPRPDSATKSAVVTVPCRCRSHHRVSRSKNAGSPSRRRTACRVSAPRL